MPFFHFSFPSAISKCQLVEVPEVIEPKTSVLILPKDIEPEEVNLADSLPVENITIIVGSTPIVQNQAIDELKQEQVAQEVLDPADDFKSSIDLKNTIENVHDESSNAPVLIVPIVSESTQSVPTSLAALLPESNLIPVATNDSLVQAPAVVAEEKTGALEALSDKEISCRCIRNMFVV